MKYDLSTMTMTGNMQTIANTKLRAMFKAVAANTINFYNDGKHFAIQTKTLDNTPADFGTVRVAATYKYVNKFSDIYAAELKGQLAPDPDTVKYDQSPSKYATLSIVIASAALGFQIQCDARIGLKSGNIVQDSLNFTYDGITSPVYFLDYLAIIDKVASYNLLAVPDLVVAYGDEAIYTQ